MSVSGPARQELLNAFRQHYYSYEITYAAIFPEDELDLVLHNVGAMQNDVRLQYEQAVDQSHHGRPTVVQTVHTGSRGRPTVEIDPHFLRWAYSLRSTASIARFLGVSRNTVRTALLEYGIAVPQQQPATLAGGNRRRNQNPDPTFDADDYLIQPDEHAAQTAQTSSYTGPLSAISDDDLDALVVNLRRHYRRAGVTMFDGMLRRLGHHVPRERIRQSLIRIDPVQRVFQRITIRRRTYHVPGPNSLWHHDGQHAAARFLAPSRVRGDHGVENLLVAAYMEALHDVTAQIGATWANVFILLELHHGLDINNVSHIWLLHYLFLTQINQQLEFFMDSWNQHQIQVRDGPNRSPADMFGFDMLVHGVRGTNVNAAQDEEHMSDAELEVYGVDWEGFQDDVLLDSRQENNAANEGSSSWIGRVGPPPAEQLNEVLVEPPTGPFSPEEMDDLAASLGHLADAVEDNEVANLWTEALILARQMHPELF
ncbi:hypothetical protein R3P38DRAFT_2785355 [Favolaschia claudopus]|uniref:Integrase core domain-containing protein n=1 Tax=Favolaschia claudopus TaxID=2862362 RepID=A0AAW0AVG9_9AGAR